ncbi:MFS transporter [Kitasatospora atroaurantiaca]|uniref:EmrB/QacA subfamily drug resistance transporter n=1 Tax=Kitasatospora atroaurantiaca TaxID=285545 RepID=A0A561EW97_9ACTN|nr:MFS transporter [Kitasatospora atroaurantiaca]TWE19885.1 EmrB/QacA subfamily drug resistance transporter [Kitasatospora atroaurantiaca]
MAISDTLSKAAPSQASRGQHKGIALAVIAATQLMVVLDATIVNIALPHIQDALEFSNTSLSWVINAYTLTFGGLLLLGGRAGDILGRRRVFIFGALLFGLASLLGGFAQDSGMLLAARALQGIGGAICSPTAFALIATNFEEGPERNRAFGVFSAVAGSGAAIGLLAGGLLTEYLNWRWVFFVNVPIAVLIAVAAPLYINESERHEGRFDLPGALTSTLGLVSLVYGFIRAASEGWSDSLTLGSFAVGVVLLALFLVIERRTAQPITPLHLLANRNRTGGLVMMLCLAAAMFGIFFYITIFVQRVLGYSPLKAGVAFLPISVAIIIAAQIASVFQAKYGPKPFMAGGAVLVTGGLTWLTQTSADSSYVTGVLGPTVVFGFGMGLIFVPVMLLSVAGVPGHETGAASGLLNSMQQIGGSLGLSILTTVFATAARNEGKLQAPDFMANATPAQKAEFAAQGQFPVGTSWYNEVLAHGIAQAFIIGAALAAVALLVSVFVIKAKPGDLPTEGVAAAVH